VEFAPFAGDLYIRLQVTPHPIFTRKGSDIYVEKEITITHAMLGEKVENMPGLDGDFTIPIPEGTEGGPIFKVEGKRMPRFDEERGDDYVIIKVSLPKRLTVGEKALLRQFERLRMLNLDPVLPSQLSFGFAALPLHRNAKAK